MYFHRFKFQRFDTDNGGTVWFILSKPTMGRTIEIAQNLEREVREHLASVVNVAWQQLYSPYIHVGTGSNINMMRVSLTVRIALPYDEARRLLVENNFRDGIPNNF